MVDVVDVPVVDVSVVHVSVVHVSVVDVSLAVHSGAEANPNPETPDESSSITMIGALGMFGWKSPTRRWSGPSTCRFVMSE